MATESPMILSGSSGRDNWVSLKEATNLKSSDNSMAFGSHKLHGNDQNGVPSRSGSAPPSMEGSFASIRNLVDPQNAHLQGRFTSLNSENFESEEQLRADPAYLAYYLSNVNLNPRLPQPLNSRENLHLAHHIGRFGDTRRLVSFDDNTSGSLYMSRATLSPHKEEPEDDKLPTHTSNEWSEKSPGIVSPSYEASPAGRHKSLVDLIQEDFPRTPSPVYNLSRSPCHSTAEGAGSQDAHVNYLSEASLSAISLQETDVTTMSISTSKPGVHVLKSVQSSDSAAAPDKTGSPVLGSLGESSIVCDEALISDVSDPEIATKMKGLTMPNLPDSEIHHNQPEQKRPIENNLPQQQLHPQIAYQAQGAKTHISSSTAQRTYGSIDHLSGTQSKSFSVEGQPVIQSSGLLPPLLANATTYMASGNPFYSNLQPSTVYGPQYSMSGFPLNPTVMPRYMAGFSPHNPIPMSYDSSTCTSFNTHSVGITTGGPLAPGLDMQQLYKYYGQPGLACHPSLTDPLYFQYFQHPSEDAQNSAGPYVSMVSRGGIVGSQDTYTSPKGPSRPNYADQMSQFPRIGALSILSPRKLGMAGPIPYGSPPNLGALMQYPTSPLASPVLPGSPLMGMSTPGRKVDNIRSPVSFNRNTGACPGWQEQRVTEKVDDHKPFSFLEELKSSKTHRFELSDIAGRIVEFSADQHGSRFIQQKLESCSIEEKAAVFEEVLPHAPTLMTDVFGNYVIQKFFEHGSPEQRKKLANQLVGHILPLSLQMYGCRVIQKALEVIELDQKTELVWELDGHVMRCVRDQNGNHVIQKCIECVPTEKIGFIISSFRGHVGALSTHPYGCRVIQRILEHCTDEQQIQCLVDEILQLVCSLAQDQYGNYVTQHVLERGKPHERSQIINKLAGQIVQLSQHKFASNVIEKCLAYGDAAERDLLIGEIVGQTEGNDNLLIMMKDQFANYVVQKILEICTDKQREVLLGRIRVHLPALKKYTYGKHIVSRVEQLIGEDSDPQNHE